MSELKNTSEYEWAHLDSMATNNITLEQLPQKIKNKANGWKMQSVKYNKNPTEKSLSALHTMSVVLAQEIQNYCEKDLPTKDGASEPKKEVNQPDTPTNIAGVINTPSNEDIKASLMKYISKDGRIHHSDLKSILGKRDIDDKLEVEGVVLERSFVFYYPKYIAHI